MKHKAIHTIFTLVLLIGLTSSCSGAHQSNVFAFLHVNLIPMNKETILTDYTVIIEDGKIKEMGLSSSISVPKGATEIDARGKFMIPALSDMHVHMEGDAWNIVYPPELRFSSEEINFNDILFMYIANGITTVEIMSAFPEHIPLREKIKNNEVLGPRLILSRMIDGAGKAWPPPISTWINNADEAGKAVLDMHRQGYDRVKVYSFLDKASYDTIIAVAKRLGMPVDGHVPLSTSIEHVLSSGQNLIAHIEEPMKFAKAYDSEQVDYYSSLIAKSNTWLGSTLGISHNLIDVLRDSTSAFARPGLEYLHPQALGAWKYLYPKIYKPIPEKNRKEISDGYNQFQKPFVREFMNKGGKLLIGSDVLMISTLPGFSLHNELEELVGAGLRPFEALKVSTTNTYAFLGELDKAGTIEPGKAANLVLLDENPLINISNARKISGVMTQNRWIPKSEIDGRLKEISSSYARLRKKKFN
jgi:cytosine/adenosine deaminase-related metal-dependent hydrolase